MKILITTDLYSVDTNGVVTSVKNLCDELRKDGHVVKILTLSENQKSRKEADVYYIRSVSLEKVYPDVRMPTSYRHKLIKELIRWKPDVIHSQCEFFTFQFALRISKCTNAPIVHTYHTLYEQYFTYVLPIKSLSRPAIELFSKKRLKKVKQLIAPTKKVEDVLRDYGLKNPIRVIPSGISLSEHLQLISPQARSEERHKLGISNDKFVLLNLGRLGTEKNIDELLRMFSIACHKFDNLVFLIVGDGPAKVHLEKLSEDLHIRDKVIFTGMIAPSEVHRYYKLGDLFVGASTSETQGLTFIEASANGLPLLCREDPCLQDVLIPGENGFTFSDENSFMDRLSFIIEDTNWRNKASEISREKAMCYDKHVFGNTVEELYDSVVV